MDGGHETHPTSIPPNQPIGSDIVLDSRRTSGSSVPTERPSKAQAKGTQWKQAWVLDSQTILSHNVATLSEAVTTTARRD